MEVLRERVKTLNAISKKCYDGKYTVEMGGEEIEEWDLILTQGGMEGIMVANATVRQV